jgi:hypothetical protein
MKGGCREDKAIAASAKAVKGGCAVAYPPYPSAHPDFHGNANSALKKGEKRDLFKNLPLLGSCRADKAIAASAKAVNGGCAAAYPPYPSNANSALTKGRKRDLFKNLNYSERSTTVPLQREKAG